MLSKRTISEKKASLVIGMLALAIASLFIASLASSAIVGESLVTIRGKVLATDPIARTVTVKSIETPIFEPFRFNGEITFSVDDSAKVMVCNENKSFDDLRAGEDVMVTYDITVSKPAADFILITSLPDTGERC